MHYPHPIDKITHFVEVGFLLDRNNFLIIDTLEERTSIPNQFGQTYESDMKKYLYELQDPINNFQMNNLEYKIKQQLMENVGLFQEINPVYISLNMGRPSEPHNDNYVPTEKFRLVKREGIYLMNDRWMMINFLKYDHST